MNALQREAGDTIVRVLNCNVAQFNWEQSTRLGRIIREIASPSQARLVSNEVEIRVLCQTAGGIQLVQEDVQERNIINAGIAVLVDEPRSPRNGRRKERKKYRDLSMVPGAYAEAYVLRDVPASSNVAQRWQKMKS